MIAGKGGTSSDEIKKTGSISIKRFDFAARLISIYENVFNRSTVPKELSIISLKEIDRSIGKKIMFFGWQSPALIPIQPKAKLVSQSRTTPNSHMVKMLDVFEDYERLRNWRKNDAPNAELLFLQLIRAQMLRIFRGDFSPEVRQQGLLALLQFMQNVAESPRFMPKVITDLQKILCAAIKEENSIKTTLNGTSGLGSTFSSEQKPQAGNNEEESPEVGRQAQRSMVKK